MKDYFAGLERAAGGALPAGVGREPLLFDEPRQPLYLKP